jgi:hypothetical protein
LWNASGNYPAAAFRRTRTGAPAPAAVVESGIQR